MAATSQAATFSIPPANWAGPDARQSSLRDRLWRLLWAMLLPADGQKTTFTMTGFVLVLVCLGIGGAAYWSGGSGGNILFLALSLLISGIILSGVLSALNFRNLSWRVHAPSRIRVAETAHFEIEIRNTKRFLPTYSLETIAIFDGEPEPVRTFLPYGIQPGETSTIQAPVKPSKRGTNKLSLRAVRSAYPFGFLRKSVSGNLHFPFVVLPPRIPYAFNPTKGNFNSPQGSFLRRPGIGEQLYNIRRYQRGDHQRLVHWKATARLRRMMVRQLMEEKMDGYILAIQTPRQLYPEAQILDTLAAFAASLAEDLYAQSRLLGYAINDDGPWPVTRQNDLRALLEKLATVDVVPNLIQPPNDTRTVTFHPLAEGAIQARFNGNPIGQSL